MLSYREIPPAAELSSFVRCFWTLRSEKGEGPRQRILPDATFDLVFHLGDPFLQNGLVQPRAMFVGEIRRPVVLEPSGRTEVFGVRFHPGGAARFLAMPMSEVRDLIVPLADVLPQIDSDAVSAAAGTRGRIAVVEAALLRSKRSADRRLDGALAAIVAASGGVRIPDVASRVGATERTMERLFDAGVGMTPKTFARVARFQASLRGDDRGYFDESHRIHDYREFAGATPAQLEREQNEMNAHFVGNLQYDEQAAG